MMAVLFLDALLTPPRHRHDDREYRHAAMGQLQPGMPPCAPSSSIPSIVFLTYTPQNGSRQYSYGLHSRCSAVTGECVPFPRTTDCVKDSSFCNMWRTVGFLITFAVVIELCTLVSFVVIMAGGVQRRSQGWMVAVALLIFSAFTQCAGMAVVVRLHSFFYSSSFYPHMHMHMHITITIWLTDPTAGLCFRKRPPILVRLAPRRLVDVLHNLVEPARPQRIRHRLFRHLHADRRRLRADSRARDPRA
jgi:hypothetical protein